MAETETKQPEVKFECRACSYSLPFRKVGFCPACGDPIDEVNDGKGRTPKPAYVKGGAKKKAAPKASSKKKK